MCAFKVAASLPAHTLLRMEILLFPAVLLLFLSDPQLIRCVSVSEKHFVWPTGSDWLVERTLVFVLLPWALLPESKVSVCVCVFASAICFHTGVCVCVFAMLEISKQAAFILHLPTHFTPFKSFKGKLSRH